jgi:hypothetical protein
MRSALAAAMLIGTTLTAMADSGPVVVIPGRPGVPVLINGRDASYAVVEGDWGLARSVHVQPVVIGGGAAYAERPVGHYFPSSGRLPGYGRVEITPPDNRRLPPQAESYHDSWSAQSGPPHHEVPQDPPPIIVAPRINIPGSGNGNGGGPGPKGP